VFRRPSPALVKEAGRLGRGTGGLTRVKQEQQE